MPFSLEMLLSLATFMFIYLVTGFALFAYMKKRRDERRRELQDQNETLESKLRMLAESSSRASSLAKQIDIEIDAMSVTAKRAEENASKAEKLAKLSTEEREAVASLVRSELGDQLEGRGKKDFRTQAGLGLFFFVLGIVASNLVPLMFQD